MRSVLLGVALIGSTASPAVAQTEIPLQTGFRIEGLIGYDHGDGLKATNAHAKAEDSDDGLLYGVGAGYDFAAGSAILGIEGEISDSKVESCNYATLPAGKPLSCASFGRDLYIGGRAGVSLGTTLLYAKAGYTNAARRTTYTTAVVGESSENDEKLDGFRLGAGLEQSISSNAFIKAEYRYSRYGQGNDRLGGTAASPVTLVGDSHDRHQVAAGLGFRF